MSHRYQSPGKMHIGRNAYFFKWDTAADKKNKFRHWCLQLVEKAVNDDG